MSLNEIGQYIYGKKESNEEKLKNTSVDESILFELEALFSHIDTDGNSVISEDELYTAMNSTPTKQYSREKVAEIMKALVSEGQNTITKEDFMKFMLTQIKLDIITAEDEMEDLRKKFKEVDLDGNGTLSPKEVK